MSTAMRVEYSFPIRVKVAVPRNGFGKQIEEIASWLKREIGEGRYGQAPAPMLGGSAAGFYFLNIEDATQFLAAFADLEMAATTL